MSAPPCAFCGRPLARRLVDLGLSPLANALVAEEDLGQPDPRYPLAAWVCAGCFLVQVPPVERRETIFSDVYPYFSSVSSTWREHCRRYAEEMVERLALGPSSLAVEIASNDGVLLAELAARGVEVLG
ncbi:MAG: SAM-dependent methyltransferase, partial [Thermoanaerobaculia bacterium]|nr:SAM-dependent methyltransferase [Thermoanaerobaculia bacterium]